MEHYYVFLHCIKLYDVKHSCETWINCEASRPNLTDSSSFLTNPRQRLVIPVINFHKIKPIPRRYPQRSTDPSFRGRPLWVVYSDSRRWISTTTPEPRKLLFADKIMAAFEIFTYTLLYWWVIREMKLNGQTDCVSVRLLDGQLGMSEEANDKLLTWAFNRGV